MQGKGISMPRDAAADIQQAIGVLRQFRGNRRAAERAVERCELCSAALPEEHPHLVELASRQLVCACDACALLFDGAERSKYKRVSRRVISVADFKMTDVQWEGLFIPINLAFFFRSSLEGRTIAFYPSPAGAVESLLTLEAWNALVDDNPVLSGMQPDVEALLVNRLGVHHFAGSEAPAAAEYFLAPIDECYKLVGLIRANWKGLAGGADVWERISEFLSGLRDKSELVRGGPDA